jgi:AcrR family transcriptional regulator
MPPAPTASVSQQHTSPYVSILRAAEKAFADYGYASATTKMIAKSAGVAPGLIYHYFSSKQELYSRVHAWTIEERYERTATLLNAQSDLPSRIRAMTTALVEIWRTDPTYVRFHARAMYETEHSSEILSEMGEGPLQGEKTWKKIVTEAAERGELPPHVSPDAVMDMCLNWLTGQLMRLPRCGPNRVVEATEVFVVGLARLLSESPPADPRSGQVPPTAGSL